MTDGGAAGPADARRIAAEAPRNDLSPDELRLRPDRRGVVEVEPGRAGWRYLSFESRTLATGESIEVDRHGHETAVVLISGGDLRVTTNAAGGARMLAGRTSPFAAPPSAVYLPSGARGRIEASVEPVSVAIARAPASGVVGAATGPIFVTGLDVEIEIRGAGNATREVRHIVAPSFPADRLLLVEVLTPSGNWSSWPPHKHDVDAMPGEAVLEEVYHYRFRRPEAWAIQRVYRRPERGLPERDATWAVGDGDVVLVTDGYHPFVAAHGDDAYYLNALAGDRRTMACSFDPDLDHVRESWSSMTTDPRVPFTA